MLNKRFARSYIVFAYGLCGCCLFAASGFLSAAILIPLFWAPGIFVGAHSRALLAFMLGRFVTLKDAAPDWDWAVLGILLATLFAQSLLAMLGVAPPLLLVGRATAIFVIGAYAGAKLGCHFEGCCRSSWRPWGQAFSLPLVEAALALFLSLSSLVMMLNEVDDLLNVMTVGTLFVMLRLVSKYLRHGHALGFS